MLAGTKCEAPPAQSENREKSPKIAKIVYAGGASHFSAVNTGTSNYFSINFKIKINHVLVVSEQKFFQIWNPLIEYFKNLQ